MSNDWHNYTDESEIIDLFPEFVEIDEKEGKKTVKKKYHLKVNGGLYVAHLPVMVPLSYCKLAEYDGGEETLSCMGVGVIINGVHIKPPSLGVYSLMEITNNPFPVDFSKTTTIQQFHVLYFNEYRLNAAELVRDWSTRSDDNSEFDADDESTWTLLDRAAIAYVDRLGESGVDLSDVNVWIKILDMFRSANNGFSMVPGGGSSKFWFGAETIGSFVAGLGQDMNCTVDDILWNIPLASVGFSYAAKARANGTKGVSRPRDQADIRRQRILAYLREANGELHQWQIDRPLAHVLTPLQAKHRHCVKAFNDLQSKAKKDK